MSAMLRAFACSVVGLAALSAAARGDEATRRQVIEKAIKYLEDNQAADGSWSSATGPAVTALAATAILRNGRSPDDPTVAKALKFLERFRQPDGGFYAENSLYKNYETAVVVQCLVEANADGRYRTAIDQAVKFLKGIQWDEGEGKEPSDFAYGGAGYGTHKRPDLSNTSFFVEALKAAGVPPDDPAMQRALIFISRCQNLESPHNRTPYAAKNPDGGFYYTPSPGQSQAGTTPEGGLRSYASMTYAGLKSMIYAGVGPDDPRVQAAFKWIRKHYSLAENPGLDQQGLYYYYHTFAKALDAMGVESIQDATGKAHRWRDELVAELARRQRADGSWVNPATRWLEGDPNLVTSYSLLALSYCAPPERR